MALIAGLLTPMATTTAPAHPLDDIARCESGGNPRAHNPSSSAAGTYQMLTTTWLANGGGRYAPTANSATPAQQREIALRLYARSGTTPWRASQSCWGGAGVRHVAPRTRHVAARQIPRRHTPVVHRRYIYRGAHHVR